MAVHRQVLVFLWPRSVASFYVALSLLCTPGNGDANSSALSVSFSSSACDDLLQVSGGSFSQAGEAERTFHHYSMPLFPVAESSLWRPSLYSYSSPVQRASLCSCRGRRSEAPKDEKHLVPYRESFLRDPRHICQHAVPGLERFSPALSDFMKAPFCRGGPLLPADSAGSISAVVALGQGAASHR